MRLDKTFGLLSGLSGTYRFSNAKLIHRESVLEHLGGVALLSFLICEELYAVEGGGSISVVRGRNERTPRKRLPNASRAGRMK